MRDRERLDPHSVAALRRTHGSSLELGWAPARYWRAAGAPRTLVPRPSMAAEYEFLVGRLIDRATLERAIGTAHRWGVAPHEVLIALGWIARESYVAALAQHLRIPTLTNEGSWLPAPPPVTLLDGTAGPPNEIAHRVAARQALGQAVGLASRDAIER